MNNLIPYVVRLVEDGGHEYRIIKGQGFEAYINGIKLEWHTSGRHIKLGYQCSPIDCDNIETYLRTELNVSPERTKSGLVIVFPNPTVDQFRRVYDIVLTHDIKLEIPQRVKRGRVKFNKSNIFNKAAQLVKFAVDNELPQVLARCGGLFDAIDEDIIIGESVDRTQENSYREHIVPCDFLIREAVVMYLNNTPLEDITQMFENNCKIVLITPDEAKKIDFEFGLKIDMPPNWELGDSIYARLNYAQINFNLKKKTITEIITSYNPKSICWYPSAGEDVQIIDTYSVQAEIVNAIQPEFFIFSDHYYFINENGALGTAWQTNFEDTLKNIGYEFVEFIDSVLQLNISNNYVLDNCEDFEDDDPTGHLKNIGVIYRKENTFILFLACENNEVSTVLEENIVVNSLILNRQMDNTPFTPRFLEVLGSLEICTGGNSNGHIYIKDFVDDARVQKISDQFKWRIADDINTDIGYIIRVIN